MLVVDVNCARVCLLALERQHLSTAPDKTKIRKLPSVLPLYVINQTINLVVAWTRWPFPLIAVDEEPIAAYQLADYGKQPSRLLITLSSRLLMAQSEFQNANI